MTPHPPLPEDVRLALAALLKQPDEDVVPPTWLDDPRLCFRSRYHPRSRRYEHAFPHRRGKRYTQPRDPRRDRDEVKRALHVTYTQHYLHERAPDVSGVVSVRRYPLPPVGEPPAAEGLRITWGGE